MTKLQAGDADYLRAWQLLCDISRADFESIYSRLGIEIQERGESYYNPMLKVCRPTPPIPSHSRTSTPTLTIPQSFTNQLRLASMETSYLWYASTVNLK